MDIMDYMMSAPEEDTTFSTVENGRGIFMDLKISVPEKETALSTAENEITFSDTENRFILTEILKASNIETNHLVNFVKFHHVEPDWHCVNVPDGRTTQQCIAVAKTLLDERMPQLPLKRNPGKILLERAPKKSRDWAPTLNESDDIFIHALGNSHQVSSPRQSHADILSPTLPEAIPSLSKDKGDADAPRFNTTQTFKQVGLSRIRIELLSLWDQRDAMDLGVNDVSRISSPELDEDGCVKDNDDDGHSTGESVGSEAMTNGAASETPVQPSSTSGNTQPSQRSSGRNEEGSGRGGSGRRRRRQGSRPPDTRAGLQRFACPYDVYHGTRDCLRRGPRNRTGGCDGIYRLKQHLRRRHMMSYRCQRCWISRDTIRQAREHHQQPTCNPKPIPANERFMEPQQENEVETGCGSMSEEDAWWRIFQVLIPHMQTHDVSSLKAQYYPYYVDVSLVIPAVNLYDVSFQPVQVGSTSELPNPNTDLLPGPLPSGPSISMPSTVQAAPALWSQTISMPVYGLNTCSGQNPTVPPVTSLPQLGPTDTTPQPVDSSPEPRASNTAPSTAFPPGQTPPLLPNSPMDGLSRSQPTDLIQLRRNYERLRLRNSQAEADIMEFREANRAYLEDLSRADMILEEIFALDDIPNEIYRRLSQVSEILVLATRRLR